MGHRPVVAERQAARLDILAAQASHVSKFLPQPRWRQLALEHCVSRGSGSCTCSSLCSLSLRGHTLKVVRSARTYSRLARLHGQVLTNYGEGRRPVLVFGHSRDSLFRLILASQRVPAMWHRRAEWLRKRVCCLGYHLAVMP